MALSDYRFALEFRAELQRLVKEEVERQRPRYQMATVTGIDRLNRKCTVQFPGDTSTAVVSMGSIQPAVTGQVVRVEGLAGDRYVSDVMGPAYQEPTRNDNMTFNGSSDFNGSVRFDGTVQMTNTLTAERGMIVANDWETNGIRGDGWQQFVLSIRASSNLIGGGVRTVNSGSIAWSDRFLAMGTGRDPQIASAGYFDLDFPPDGTVITGHGGATDQTVSGGIMPFGNWIALYYEPPFGSGSPTDHSNWHRVNYTSDYVAPSHWIFVAIRNGDWGQVIWADGREQDYWRTPTFLNGWTNYGGSYEPINYRRDNGIVRLRGLADNGTISQTSTGNMFTLPVGYRPGSQLVFPSVSANVGSRVDVYADGSVRAMTGTTWVALNGIQFMAYQ